MRERLEKVHGDIIRNLAKLTDDERLDCVELHDSWQPGKDYSAGEYRKHSDRLYKCRQGHTSQAGWEPDVTPALWEEVSREPGTHDNPIPYNNNMELKEGLYYTQYEVLYICIRSTGVPVYNDLKDLIDIYVEVTE